MPRFQHFDIRLVDPSYDSPVTDDIVALEQLKARSLRGTTHPGLFFELKSLFQILESLGSSRIEGNRTTLYEAIEAHLGRAEQGEEERFAEIVNLQRAMEYIETVIDPGTDISSTLLHELHRIAVVGLATEGDPTPGAYRQRAVQIQASEHLPPSHPTVPGYMDELLVFINQEVPAKRQLMLIALAHHRFAWIHPYNNGNGRVVRLLTYAMLIQRGYRVKEGQLINPTAVFCADRNIYYDKLSSADAGTDDGLLDWSGYVLQGLREEIEKIDKLLDHEYLLRQILRPALEGCRDRGALTDREYRTLRIAARKQIIVSRDLRDVVQGGEQRSRLIRSLRDRNLLRPVQEGQRKYRLSFTNNALMHAVTEALISDELIPTLD